MPSALLSARLAQADRAHVLAALATFRNKTGKAWLGATHPLRFGALKNASWGAVLAMPPTTLIQAVAASAPNHCVDGWSYISRATSALISGDGHAARHLAYYAQLRAGLSMLANLGVGVFNRINFAVTAGGDIRRIDTAVTPPPRALGLGTHEVVWEALKHIASDNTAAALLLGLLKVRNVPLRDCLEALWPGGSFLAAASSLIGSWGLDLKRGRQEHRSRNISSYNPQGLNPISTPAAESLEFVSQTWRLFEPTSSSSFDQLDRFLLRRVLHSQHRAVLGHSRYDEGPIQARYNDLPAIVRSLASIDFLTNQTAKANPELLKAAKKTSDPSKPTEMLSRAFLLLRAATSVTHSSFLDAGVNCAGGETRPWIDKLAEERGFWEPGNPLPDLIPLWDDVELALIDLDASLNPPPVSWNDWMTRSAKGLPTVAEVERIGVWSLGS